MEVYIAIYSIPFLLSFLDTSKTSLKTKKAALFIIIVLFTLFRGLRWNNGTDWPSYFEVFYKSGIDNIFSYDRYGEGSTLMEPGYMLLNYIIKMFGNYTLFLVITNAAILINYYYFIKKTKTAYPIISYALLLVSVDFFPVRQDFAIGIYLWAFYVMLNRNTIKRPFVKYLLLCVAGAMFHKSCIVLIPLYFVMSFKRNMVTAAICVFISVVPLADAILEILVQYSDVINISLTSMSALEIINNHIDEFEISIVSQIYFFCWFLLFVYYKKYISHPFFQEFLNGYVMTFIFIQLFYNPLLIGFSRLAQYFFIFFPLCFSGFMDSWHHTKKFVIRIVFIALYWYKFSRLDDAFPEVLYPYHFILFY